jgi:hypothetical protein
MIQSMRRPALSLIAFCAAAVLLLSPSRFEAQASQTPTDVFNAYRAALAKASSYDELLPFMEAKGKAMVEAVPEPQRAGMFGYLKKFAATYTEVAVTKETVTGDTALLTLSGKDPKGQPATGSVPMTKESSGWKVGTEKWRSSPR